jgi:hypothetical protein
MTPQERTHCKVYCQLSGLKLVAAACVLPGQLHQLQEYEEPVLAQCFTPLISNLCFGAAVLVFFM